MLRDKLIRSEVRKELLENLSEQYAPQVIGAGGVQSLIGTGARVSAPRDVEGPRPSARTVWKSYL